MRDVTVLENREIKKHVTKAVFPNLFLGILLCIVLLLLNVLIAQYLIIPPVKNVEYLKGKYKQVVVSNEYYPGYCLEYQFSDLITVSNGTGYRINTNAYMTLPEINKQIFAYDLKKDEIAISEKVAQKLGLGTGDKVYLELSIFEKPKEYTVAALIPYCWNYYDILDNSDFSVVHIGYDEQMVQSTAMKTAYFLNENEYNDYLGKYYSYANHYDVEEELQTIRTRSTLLIVVCIVISTLLTGGFLWFLSRRIKREAVKYHYNGYKAAFVKLIHFVDYLLLYIIPLCLFGVCITIMSIAIHFVYLYMLTIVLIGLVMAAIMYFKEIKSYGKAH